MGLDGLSFTNLHKAEISQIRRQFGEYIKGLSRQKGIIDTSLATMAAGEPDVPIISITANGFPLLPAVDLGSKTKECLASLMRQYLGKHYSMLDNMMIGIMLTLTELASGGHSDHVPFGRIKSDRSAFINDEYLPCNICITDPHNMKKQEIQDFLDHVQKRQVKYGAEMAFRFRAYQRRQALHPAIYVERGQHEAFPATAIEPQAPRAMALQATAITPQEAATAISTQATALPATAISAQAPAMAMAIS
jgi:hypothetical protein